MASIGVGASELNSKLFNDGFLFLCVHIGGIFHSQNIYADDHLVLSLCIASLKTTKLPVALLVSNSGGTLLSFDYCFQFHITHNS